MQDVSAVMDHHGFLHWGWTTLSRPISLDFYREWLAKGHHADMHYLVEHEPIKEDPQKLAPSARAAIVVTKPYLPHPYPHSAPISHLRTALYARGEDYHLRFRQELEQAAGSLRELYPAEQFLCFTDSAPILERDLAYRAGLGWFGKNSCLIHPNRGSLFFIGEILTSLKSPAPKPHVPDMCGTCDRCQQICPTQALTKARELDATKCIAYWTIEAKKPAPEDLRSRFGDWFFGCDLCQTVCPWNEKFHGRDLMRDITKESTPTTEQIEELRWILRASNKELTRHLKNSPLERARPRGLKRNALVVIGNLKLNELKSEVQALLNHPDLGRVAQWSLGQLA